MLPQKPPQPSCSYFPLKLVSVGIQTSKLIIESFVGVAVPATRQNCGSPVFVVQPVLPDVQPGGVLKIPPVMVCAAVICPWGSDRFTRPSHVVAAYTAVAAKKTAANDAVAIATGFRYSLILSSHSFICPAPVIDGAGLFAHERNSLVGLPRKNSWTATQRHGR